MKKAMAVAVWQYLGRALLEDIRYPDYMRHPVKKKPAMSGKAQTTCSCVMSAVVGLERVQRVVTHWVSKIMPVSRWMVKAATEFEDSGRPDSKETARAQRRVPGLQEAGNSLLDNIQDVVTIQLQPEDNAAGYNAGTGTPS